MVVSSSGVSNAVGSGSRCSLHTWVSISNITLVRGTYPLKMPNVHANGIQRKLSRRLFFSVLEHIACSRSSSHLAIGSLATNSKSVSDVTAREKILTVPQSRHDRQHTGVKRIPIIVDTHEVNVQHPRCLFRLDTQC
jgi:hypothetical protein